MKKEIPQMLVSDSRGKISSISDLAATGMKGGHFFRLEPKDLIKLPPTSRLFMLPSRTAVDYDEKARDFKAIENCLAVSAFVSPGFTATFSAAYKEIGDPGNLPLFSYGAAAFYKNEFYAAAIKIDKDIRHDSRFINFRLVRKNARRLKKMFPRNRLITHLKDCALVYGCPNAQNFFLSRYEAPLPVSPLCNASCAGCISYQAPGSCPASQPRIKFIPKPEEISEIALFHISRVKNPIVSYGQGCEGEPLLFGDIVAKSIKLIRAETKKGIININTNGSSPEVISRLFGAGLDSARVSLNSAQERYYNKYYKPKGYRFRDVVKSIKAAKKKSGFISLNYLTMPGFTDLKEEFAAFKNFICDNRIDMIQWRNLNFDPLGYFRELGMRPDASKMLGINEIIGQIKKSFPGIRMGYFNPAKL